MSIRIRYPNITGEEPRQQLSQLRSFLYQLVDELNYALEQLERREKNGE